MPPPLSTAADIERDLHARIPLARAMQVRVDAADGEAVCLSAPFAPNRNPHQTVFGGSSAALALLAGWTLLTLRLRAASLAAHVVIQRSRISYEAPIRDTFRACCTAPPEGEWERFVALLARRGRGRLTLKVDLHTAAGRAGVFEGAYVALREAPDG